MKNIICLLAAAALFTGCAGTNNEADRGSAETGVGVETGTERSSSGSLTNGTSGSQTNGATGIRTNQSETTTQTPTQTPQTPSETPSQTPTQTPRGN